MSGTDHPDAPPPEVPEEFADAYREAYRRALESDDPGAEMAEVPPQEVVVVGTHRAEHAAAPAQPRPPRERPSWSTVRDARWFLPGVIAVSALVLVSGAYAVGVALSGDDDAPHTASPSAVHTSTPHKSASPDKKTPEAEPSTSPGGWQGPVDPVAVDAISADCTAPASNDSAGHRVTYVPENAIDDKADTAWRCSGTAVGQKLTLRITAGADVAEIGLVPGYAKTDPASGADRYAENNRITRVRWTLADGVSFLQRLDPDPSSRAVQLLRVPPTDTDTITLQILAVKRGPRNTTAISQIVVRSAA
jgi:hypothetical protein